MTKSLVIVESPAKAKTINKFLGKEYVVKASYGHVKDLPPKGLAVDIEHGFAPQYEVIKGREKVLALLKKAAKASKAVYLAADLDREGEAICWHLAQELEGAKRPIRRVTFNEITKRAVLEGFAHPGSIDRKKVEAQQARRILDRLVGYRISPLLWEKVRRGLSAGRVQSVALRLIVDREREIRVFVREEYWTIEALLQGKLPSEFRAKLFRIGGEKPEIGSEEEARRLVEELEREVFLILEVTRKEKRRYPVPPFTTSTLQQEAARKLKMSVQKTMRIAQGLYEGVEIGKEGAVGLITYMRTDSTRVSAEAGIEARRYIAERFGGDFLPERPPVYRSAKGAQEAHEAIRPTSVFWDPAFLRGYLTRDQLQLYTLIWNRFVASQMPPALYDATTVDIEAGRFLLRASGRVLRFAGFTRLYIEGEDERAKTRPEEASAEEDIQLPPLEVGEMVELLSLHPEQHFTQPPPRSTEASLVKELEEKGIGRPSTYATILSAIQNRDYVVKEDGKFRPTELGEIVVDLLVKSFPRIMDYHFTATMEGTLDQIEEGEAEWRRELQLFYDGFSKWVAEAKIGMENLKALEEKTDEMCERCGSPMVIRWGRFGKFLACSAYPDCKNTRELSDLKFQVNSRPSMVDQTDQVCEKCGKPLVMKRGRYGPFLACSGYPECRNTRKLEGRRNLTSIPLDVNCPQCSSPLTTRRSKKGRTFYGCGGYPACSFALWERPRPTPCPRCSTPFLVERKGKDGLVFACASEGCGYTTSLPVP